MIMVLSVHCNFLSLGEPSVVNFSENPLSCVLRYFFEYACVIGVNVFVLISGFFGIKFSTKRLIKFCIYVLYWGLIVVGIIWLLNTRYHFLADEVSIAFLAKSSMRGGGLWFVGAYIILMVLSIPLNQFIKTADNKTILLFLGIFFGLETIDIFYQMFRDFQSGYSAVSFIGIYTLGAYIKKNINVFARTSLYYFLCYLGFIAIVTLSIILIKYVVGVPMRISMYFNALMLSYSGPFNIFAAGLLFLSFMKMKFHVPLINYVAISTFGVYLLHTNAVIFGTYLKWCRYIYARYDFIAYSGMIVATFVGIVIFVVIVDQGRKAILRLILK